MTSFSVAPLRLASLLGLLLAGAAFIFGMQILIETIVFGQSVPGYPSVVVGLMVLGGVQLIMIGIMGEYIGKILSELKARPVYFVAEHTLKPPRTPSGRRSAGAIGGGMSALTSEVHRYKIGDIAVTVLSDGFRIASPDGYIRNAGKDELAATLKAAGLPTDHMRNTYAPIGSRPAASAC